MTVRSCPQLCARSGVSLRHEVGRFEVLRRMIRVGRVLTACVIGLWLRMIADRILRTRRAAAYTQPAARRVVDACGIRLDVGGARTTFADAGEPVLVVANHVSWLDVIAMWAVQPVTMVSKQEIGQWPVLGMVARAAGTIFIDRFRLRSLPQTRQAIGRELRAGNVVATFPEATTTCGRGMARLYPAMFQAAIDVGVPVQPVALWFEDRVGGLTTAGSYVGDQPLLDSIMEILRQRDLVLRFEVLPRILPKHVRPIDDRRALRDAAAESIAAALDPVVGEHGSHLRPTTCVASDVRRPTEHDPLRELLDVPPLPVPA